MVEIELAQVLRASEEEPHIAETHLALGDGENEPLAHPAWREYLHLLRRHAVGPDDAALQSASQRLFPGLGYELDHAEVHVMLLEPVGGVDEQAGRAENPGAIEDQELGAGIQRRLQRLVHCLLAEREIGDWPGDEFQPALLDEE